MRAFAIVASIIYAATVGAAAGTSSDIIVKSGKMYVKPRETNPSIYSHNLVCQYVLRCRLGYRRAWCNGAYHIYIGKVVR